jgi:hypothetical protein
VGSKAAADHHRLCASVVVTNETLMRVMEYARSGAFDQERQVRIYHAAKAMPSACGSREHYDCPHRKCEWLLIRVKSKFIHTYHTEEKALRLSTLVS